MSKPRRHKGCPRTGKTRFRDEAAARQALARTRKRVTFTARPDDGSHPAARVYPCPFCRGWHLTSRPERDAS